jgi:drug/metabolite transporter (DMT)-like permease
MLAALLLHEAVTWRLLAGVALMVIGALVTRE